MHRILREGLLLSALGVVVAGTDTRAASSGASASLPGAPPLPADVGERIRAAAARRSAENPRTRHLLPDGSAKYTNRLVLEASPYLQQHAHNPVNWFSWGEEAFSAAAALHRPILLSVGYSTCHWCHVMEEESFEDDGIARLMNERYVAIKVDREERPDIDAIYMSAVQMMTGSGGWPMTVWLTPDRKPFHGGTYFPARDGDRGARVGFLTLLVRLADIYEAEPGKAFESAERLAAEVKARLAPAAGGGPVDASVLARAASFYKGRFDAQFGGLTGAPKFPSSLPVRFLLREANRTGEARLTGMATRTLDRMAEGGIHDQVGGGFHRYSTDAQWLVPHFEKMLYDNALRTIEYLEAYQVTGEKRYAEVARTTLTYVEREMTSPEGAFYSAGDADSPAPSGKREEGRFFTWTPREIDAVLGPERGRVVRTWFGVTEKGNLEGRNILRTPRALQQAAKELGVTPSAFEKIVDAARPDLYKARARRPPPHRDDKILAAWNGLMISATSRAALVLGDEKYARAAERAASFILDKMRRRDRLFRSYKDGQLRHAAYLDDYAFVAAGLLDLFEATGEPRWLREAIALDQVLAAHFEDAARGGFFMTSDDAEALLTREKPSYDGAEPTGSSVHVLNLLRLHELTTDDSYRKRAEKAFAAFGKQLSESPASLSEMLLALELRVGEAREIVIVTPHSRKDAEPFLDVLRRVFLPSSVLVVTNEGPPLAKLSKLAPLVEGKSAIGGKATAYVCTQGSCKLPATSPSVFEKQLRKGE